MNKCRNTGCENQTVEDWHDYCLTCLEILYDPDKPLACCGICSKRCPSSDADGWKCAKVGHRWYLACSEDHWGQMCAKDPILSEALGLERRRQHALPGPGRVMLQPAQVAALASWARAEEEGGVSGWGPLFDAAMKAAKEVTRA